MTSTWDANKTSPTDLPVNEAQVLSTSNAWDCSTQGSAPQGPTDDTNRLYYDRKAMLAAALSYGRKGIPVFPLKPYTKEPSTSQGFKDATTDEETIREWFSAKDRNIGIPTGGESGLLVLDGDTYKSGVTDHPEWQSTIRDRSPRGGHHEWFRYPPGCGLTIGSNTPEFGWDFRGEGGYIVAPPSIVSWQTTAPDGSTINHWGQAHWTSGSLEDEVPFPPIDLLDRLRKVGPAAQPEAYHTWTAGQGGEGITDPQYWLDWALKKARAGERSHWCAQMAYQMRDNHIPEEDALAAGAQYAEAVSPLSPEPYTVKEAEGTIRSAYRNPREGRAPSSPRAQRDDRGTEELPSQAKQRRQYARTTRSAKENLMIEHDPIKWAIPGFLPQGLTILGGGFKIGKSWLCLDLALAVSQGKRAFGQIATEQAGVLYLALEDNDRRMKDRMLKMLQGEEMTGDFEYATAWERFDDQQRGLDRLEDYLTEHPDIRLVIVDTIGRVHPHSRGQNGPTYLEEVTLFERLQDMAWGHNTAILLVTHKSKGRGEDPLEGIIGSVGQGATADNAMLLDGSISQGTAVLHIRGRDIDLPKVALRWEDHGTHWVIAEESGEYFELSERQREVIDIFKANENQPLSVADIQRALGEPNRHRVDLLVGRMASKNMLIKSSTRGTYWAADLYVRTRRSKYMDRIDMKRDERHVRYARYERDARDCSGPEGSISHDLS